MTDHPTPSGKLIVSHDGPITTLTLNRPEVHNALDREVSAELNAAIKQIDIDHDCRVVVLRGAGETFCAGDDIKSSTPGPTTTSSGRSASIRRR